MHRFLLPSCVVIPLAALLLAHVSALNIVIAGGTGRLGRALIPKLSDHDVTVLTRNAFLAATPSRVSSDFGHLGLSFLTKHPFVKLRDWDGGDLTDIVGQDWVGWQDDVLKSADVLVYLVGGYTQQRNMATERLVRESIRINRDLLHVTVNPVEQDIPILSPGMVTVKTNRIKECEDMVKMNCFNSKCLRLEVYKMEETIDRICAAILGDES
jgi:nucleoside-diphosphate-sugar epimerase